MKHKICVLLFSIIICQLLYSQNVPADGIYKPTYGKTLLYKSGNTFFTESDNRVSSGKITFKDKTFKITYPTKFNFESFSKKGASDSLIVRIYDPELNIDIDFFDTESTFTVDTLTSKILFRQLKEYRIKKHPHLNIKLFNDNNLIKAYYTIPEDISELNIYIKDYSDYKSVYYDWRYGISENEIEINDSFYIYYIDTFDGYPTEKAPNNKGFNKLDADSTRHLTFIEFLKEENAASSFLTQIDNIPASDYLIDTEEIKTDSLSIDSVETIIDDDYQYYSWIDISEKYLQNSEDDIFIYEKKSLDDLIRIAKEKNKLIRIYYKTDMDLLKILTGTDNLSSPYSINSFYIVQEYDTKDFKQLKKYKIKNTPQILIIDKNGNLLYSETNPYKLYTKEEKKDGFLDVYKKYLLQENDELIKITEKSESLDAVKAYLKNTNTLLIALRLNNISYYDDNTEDKNALVFSFDLLANMPVDEELINLVIDYFRINNTYEIQIDKLPVALVYLLKNTGFNKQTQKDADAFVRNSFTPNNTTVRIIENAISQVPDKKELLMEVFLKNTEGETADSFDIKVDFVKKYFHEIIPDSVNSYEPFYNTYPYYLNNLAWKIYTEELNNNYPDALLFIDRALGYKENASFLDTKAHILYRFGRKEEAITTQMKAVEEAKKIENKQQRNLSGKKLDLELMIMDLL